MNRVNLPFAAAAMAAAATAACQLADGDPHSSDETPTAAALAAADEPTCTTDATVVVTPSVIPPTRPEVPVVLDVAVTNPRPASCGTQSFDVHVMPVTELVTDPRPDSPGVVVPRLTLASGETGHVPVTVTVPASADAGDVLSLSLNVITPPSGGGGGGGVVIVAGATGNVPPIPFTVAAIPGCQVSAAHELMIRDLSVVDDPIRTVFDPASRDPRNGAWTLKRLAEAMAPRPQDAPAMIEAMLTSFTAPRTVNGFTVAPRAGITPQVLAVWPRTASGALDLAKAPVHLQAIVNRFDLRDLANGDAGEGRFVFAFDLAPTPAGPPPQATLIFEYKLPARRDQDVTAWAQAFHTLGRVPFGELYNTLLQGITERFVRRGARPGHPNGSAINAVRTNEVPFGDDGIWELREFHLSAASGMLEPSPLALTPDRSFDSTAALASYINANQAQILTETHTVPALFEGAPFQAGAVFNDLNTWFAPGVDSEARHHFAINTCNGCHAAQETGTIFLHLAPRTSGQPSQRSRWLTGTLVNDPVTGAVRAFDDLARRKADLKTIVCGGTPAPTLAQLRKGISRVH